MAPRDLDCGDDVIEMDDDDLDAIDVLGTGAVMKKILKEAPDVEVEYGHPETGDQCKIAYEGYVLGWDDERMRSEKMCHRNYLVTLGSDEDINRPGSRATPRAGPRSPGGTAAGPAT